MVKSKKKVNMKSVISATCLLFFLLIFSGVTTAQQNDPNNKDFIHKAAQETGEEVGGTAKNEKILKKILNSLFNTNKNTDIEVPGKSAGNATSTSGDNSNSGSELQKYTPPPNISGADESQYADAVAKMIQADCTNEGKGVVTVRNSIDAPYVRGQPSCLTRIGKDIEYPKNILENSAKSFEWLQCVGCIIAEAEARGRPYAGTGYAKQHIGQKVAGYTYFANKKENLSQLIPGSIGISNTGTYGHIFYITEVIKDSTGKPTYFKGFECNWGLKGSVRHDITRPLSYMVGWQRPNSL